MSLRTLITVVYSLSHAAGCVFHAALGTLQLALTDACIHMQRAQQFRLQRQQRQALAGLQQNLQAPVKPKQPKPYKAPPAHLLQQEKAVDHWGGRASEQAAAAPVNRSVSSVMEEVRRLEGRTAKAALSRRDLNIGRAVADRQGGAMEVGLGHLQSSSPSNKNGALLQRVPASSPGWPQALVYKAGKVPNFGALHALWAQKLAAARAAVQKRLTVPKVRTKY